MSTPLAHDIGAVEADIFHPEVGVPEFVLHIAKFGGVMAFFVGLLWFSAPTTVSRDGKRTQSDAWRNQSMLRMLTATLMLGVGTGLIGIFVANLISQVQVLGYGNAEGDFFIIAASASPLRRLLCVCAGGAIGTSSWYWLRGIDPAIVPVKTSMEKGTRMPVQVTIFNAMLQDVVVALGGSFGREAAPREMAACLGGNLADSFQLTPAQRKVLVACGAGAGLSAVYSVPISGALYTIETMLNWDLSAGAVIPAIITSCIGAIVASVVVPTDGLYAIPLFSDTWPSASLLFWGLTMGPLTGIVAGYFDRLLNYARKYRPKGRLPISFEAAHTGQSVHLLFGGSRNKLQRFTAQIMCKTEDRIMIRRRGRAEDEVIMREEWVAADPFRRDNSILVMMPTAFLTLGLVAYFNPFVLGNGRALAELAFDEMQSRGVLAVLFVLKALATIAAIGSGADGGTLTPSVALGATFGAIVSGVLGAICPVWWPGPSVPPFEAAGAITGAAFLAATMQSPVTGLWLMVEFTAQGVDRAELWKCLGGDVSGLLESKVALGMLLPMALAVAGSTMSFRWMTSQQ